MKNILLILGLFFVSMPLIQAQNDRFSQDFEPIRSELTKWDPIRGEWLASSLVAMSKKQPIPDRTFPEDFTPAEMLKMVPESNRLAIQQVVTNNQKIATDSTGRNEWNQISSVVSRPSCTPVTGRTYGDPHLSSFDNATYSFQTVGEFVLAKSETQNMEIQTRQQPQSDDFSLNTAVAMNVGGDRVCIYANEKPDNVSTSALRLNGSPVNITRSTYFLPHGGTIRYSSNTYTITWPTGEVANAQIRHSSSMNFINLTVQVYPCAQQDLQGLLGNANGREQDDFETGSVKNRPAYMAFSSFGNSQMQQASNDMEKEYLAFLARDYANDFRVTDQTTLFDYGFGQNTLTFTDQSFPRVHRTVGDLPNDRQIAARKTCEDQGVRGAELKGCIYDNAYLQIAPNPRPTITDPTSGVTLARMEKPIKNVNPKPGIPDQEDQLNGKGDGSSVTPQTLDKPDDKIKVKNDKSDVGETSPETKPSTTTEPVSKPGGFSIFKGSGSSSSGSTSSPSGGGTKPTNSTPIKTTPAIKTTPVVKPGKG